eukprot:scaffold3810_cov120-Isochrysis_galbana.AAC.4
MMASAGTPDASACVCSCRKAKRRCNGIQGAGGAPGTSGRDERRDGLLPIVQVHEAADVALHVGLVARVLELPAQLHHLVRLTHGGRTWINTYRLCTRANSAAGSHWARSDGQRQRRSQRNALDARPA